jgi:hypothetical protein
LCQTQSCQAVGDYVRIGETSLLLLGAAFFWVLWLVFFLATRLNKPVLWHMAGLALMAALAFDGALLGYQFMGLGMQCVLCVAVGAALFANLLSLAWVRQAGLMVLIGLVVWLGGFAANSILVLTPAVPELEQTAFVSQQGESSQSKRNYYLFFSLNCGHCQVVLANLAMSAPHAVNIHLCSLDDSPQAMAKLAWVQMQADKGKDPVSAVLELKQDRELGAGAIPGRIRESVGRAKKFFAARGYRGVPLLVAREGRGKEVVVTGSRAIARYLSEVQVVEK